MIETILRSAVVLFVYLTLLTGIAYPVVVTGIAQGVFRSQANGSLLSHADGRVIGSGLIGQSFTEPRYFHGRPSATAESPYNAAASGGSNQGPLNPALITAVQERIAALHALDPDPAAAIPVDLVTASGSGLDPHISVAAAHFQVARVSRVRHLDPRMVSALIESHTENRLLGVIGEPRVNVLLLNLALDKQGALP